MRGVGFLRSTWPATLREAGGVLGVNAARSNRQGTCAALPGFLAERAAQPQARRQGLGISASGRRRSLAAGLLETRRSCLKLLFNALRFYRDHGVRVLRLMTGNGVSFRSYRYTKALRMLTIKHKRTRPSKNQRKGSERAAALLPFLHDYNDHRPHFGINASPPISSIPRNNLSRHDS